MTRASLHFLWQDRQAAKPFRTGVSLHSHTMHSEESLDVIPRYTAGIPVLGRTIRAQERRYRLDFSRAFWTPPLAPREAFQLEQSQIENGLGLRALVSLTDHDNLHAVSRLRILDGMREAPVSVEWTIPFGPTFFHLGVHNLPFDRREAVIADLGAYTQAPREIDLRRLLEMLNGFEDVLLVLNHPLWDEKGIGIAQHAQALGRLIERHGRSFHALELNGLRSWGENAQVISVSGQSGHPLISGGDRHGREANANVNLTNATSFQEFVHEVRNEGISEILFMPQYREPLKLRVIETMRDIVREYPEALEGRRRWADRFFYRGEDGIAVPLSSLWSGDGPALIKHTVSLMRLLESRPVRSTLRLALAEREFAKVTS